MLGNACERCGTALLRATRLMDPATGDGALLYQCPDCKHLNWRDYISPPRSHSSQAQVQQQEQIQPDRTDWQAGQRVVRKDSDELGTVVEIEKGQIKVLWEGGRTSYFRQGDESNLELAPE